jgi:hypothetical protein
MASVDSFHLPRLDVIAAKAITVAKETMREKVILRVYHFAYSKRIKQTRALTKSRIVVGVGWKGSDGRRRKSGNHAGGPICIVHRRDYIGEFHTTAT